MDLNIKAKRTRHQFDLSLQTLLCMPDVDGLTLMHLDEVVGYIIENIDTGEKSNNSVLYSRQYKDIGYCLGAVGSAKATAVSLCQAIHTCPDLEGIMKVALKLYKSANSKGAFNSQKTDDKE